MLSTMGRKPTMVPVRGKVSIAGSEPWPVPKEKTSLPLAIESAQASAAAPMAAPCVARTCSRRSTRPWK